MILATCQFLLAFLTAADVHARVFEISEVEYLL
jgi:hypothetical protein